MSNENEKKIGFEIYFILFLFILQMVRYMKKVLKKIEIFFLLVCILLTYTVTPERVGAVESRDLTLKVIFLETNGSDPSEVSDSFRCEV